MSESQRDRRLGESFRQSRKEFWFMVVTWGVFAGWTVLYVGAAGRSEPGEPLDLVWGMPRWVVFGVMIPWALGLSITVWFATRFMKDTDLDPDTGEGKANRPAGREEDRA